MLYLIATPIGNLEDLTERAKRILGEVDLVLAEDTRQVAKILSRIDQQVMAGSDPCGLARVRPSHKRVESFHEHSDQKIGWVIGELKNGRDIALVSDAGTPNLSDPGGKLVEAALREKIEISPIPGPSALTALISVAPFSCTHFEFFGFFPKKKGRQKMLTTIKSLDHPVFFFESPHRIKKTLDFLAAGLQDHKILIGRELTKKFEQIVFSDLDDPQLSQIPDKGEFVFALIRK